MVQASPCQLSGKRVLMGPWPFQGVPQAHRVRKEPPKEADLGERECRSGGCKCVLSLPIIHMDRGK